MPTQHQVYFPSAPFRPFVRCFLDVQMGSAGQSINCLLPAKTEQCIYISTGTIPSLTPAGGGEELLSDRFCCTVRGAMESSSLRLMTDRLLSMFVIIFHPGAFYRFFNIPASHFSHAFTEAGISLGRDWEELGNKLRETDSGPQRVKLAEECLAKNYRPVKKQLPVDQLVSMLPGNYQVTVHELARRSFLSERQFRRCFLERTGLSPQNFLRVTRANHALQMKRQEPQQSWGTVAYNSGYTDLSHLSREMKHLMGLRSLTGGKFMDVQGIPFRIADV